MYESILKMSEQDQELEFVQFHFEKMFRSFAFFAGTTVEAIKESEYIDEVARIYYSSIKVLLENEDELSFEREFVWNDEIWILQSPELKHGDKMTFGELIDSKQIIQDLIKLGASQWECLLPLCAIYLRKQEEVYEENFLYEGSERIHLMESLPLDIALQVGFFLSSSLNMFRKVSQSSTQQESKQLANMLRSTLRTTDGSTFSNRSRRQRSSTLVQS